jgi:hypothetical protein
MSGEASHLWSTPETPSTKLTHWLAMPRGSSSISQMAAATTPGMTAGVYSAIWKKRCSLRRDTIRVASSSDTRTSGTAVLTVKMPVAFQEFQNCAEFHRSA